MFRSVLGAERHPKKAFSGIFFGGVDYYFTETTQMESSLSGLKRAGISLRIIKWLDL